MYPEVAGSWRSGKGDGVRPPFKPPHMGLMTPTARHLCLPVGVFLEQPIGGTFSCCRGDTAFGAIPAHFGRRACNRRVRQRVLDGELAGSILDHRDEQHGPCCCHCPSSKRRAGGDFCGLRIGRNRVAGAARSRRRRSRRRPPGRHTRTDSPGLAGNACRHRSTRYGTRVVVWRGVDFRLDSIVFERNCSPKQERRPFKPLSSPRERFWRLATRMDQLRQTECAFYRQLVLDYNYRNQVDPSRKP